MKKIILIILLSTLMFDVSAQTIRKPWSELTLAERAAYVSAINSLTKSQVQNLANEHDRLFNLGIHGVPQFLPWHRIFLQYFEGLIQSVNPNVSIPYWNWHETWNSSSLLFQNSSAQNTGILGYNVNGSIWEDPLEGTMFNRGFTSEAQPNDNYKNQTTYSTFSNVLQTTPHNAGHRFVGGDMVARYSPIDPIFYMHHCMVDKAWWDWYNGNPTADVSILDNNMVTFNGYPVSTINAQTLINSRDLKIWYAYNNLLILNNYVSNGTELYNYTTGSIEARNFIVPNSANVLFQTNGQNITLGEGFEVNFGGTFEVKTN